MPSTDPPKPLLRARLGNATYGLSLAVAATLAGLSLAHFQADNAAAKETALLATLTGLMLLLVAWLTLDSKQDRVLTWTAVLAVTVLWIIDFGPHRGAALAIVLMFGLGLASWQEWQRCQGDLVVGARFCVPAALAIYLLTRPQLLLAPLEANEILGLVYALLFGLLLTRLGPHFGAAQALLAGVSLALLGSVAEPSSVAALACLVAGCWLGESTMPPWQRGLAAISLVSLVMLVPGLGTVGGLAGLSLALPGRWLALVPLAALAPILGGDGSWSVVIASVAALIVLLPTLPLAVSERRLLAATALLLTVAAAREGSSLAAPLALASLCLGRTGLGRTGPGRNGLHRHSLGMALQWTWTVSLGALTLLLAAYPWLRAQPLANALALLGWEGQGAGQVPETAGAAGAPLSGAPLGGLSLEGGVVAWWLLPSLVLCALALLGRVGLRLPIARGLVLLLLASACALHLPKSGEVALRLQPVVLDESRPRWAQRIELPRVGMIKLDTNLVQGASLPAGTAVALLQLYGGKEGRELLARKILRAGEDTAEWAAARADVAAQPGFSAPPSWISYLAPDGSFFGQRFRTRWSPKEPQVASRIVLSRRASLPPSVQLVVYRVEALP